ncbi:ornithine cyclodeaminase family protein [Gymnodinialimonas ceratoperidinii]|uniref:NAD(P)-binding domain-containing protein n=1 Tax=Gymnodinialimonas ceratoperidinii TaxID=2856823 RepID=A0A8F6YD79_9RHOB|nr:NAD(P)-binding domain-containing protein [Gymnodinialimonas ceratoperidinii]QXT39922.1 NAD(P)-binding domain-containing protein [Gymnodinialimonas ceratoperidinii]
MTLIIGPEAEAHLDWIALSDAIEAGHKMPRAEIDDTFLYRGDDTLLSRAAWIDGLGQLVKTATIFPGNKEVGKPAINGGVCLFSDEDGTLEAIVDFHLLTKWKTAGDSLLAARKLARPDAKRILLVGAGNVAASLVEAYSAAFPEAEFTIWNRSPAKAATFAARYPGMEVARDLEEAAGAADIIGTATMATDPVLAGKWLSEGTHLDLIGAYRPDMREVDDDTLRRARVFVDSRATTLGHIGELKIPLEAGVFFESDVVGDFYEMESLTRGDEREITLCKNGGGAHLDLMVARYILDAVRAR